MDEEQNASIDLFGTLKARTEGGGFEGTVLQPSLYESHPNDSRVTGPVAQCPTVSARWGTSGNNTPLVTAQDQIPFETTGLGDVRAGDIATTLRRNSGASGESQNAAYVLVKPSEALPLAYDDRNQAVSTDTHHTLRGEAAGSRVSDAVVQSGQPSNMRLQVFQQNTRDEVRFVGGDGQVAGALAAESGMKQTNYILSTEQLQRFQIEAVMVPEQTVIGFKSKASFPNCGLDIAPTMSTEDVQAIPIQDVRPTDKAQNGIGVGNVGDPSYTLDKMATQGVAVVSGTQIEAVMVPEQTVIGFQSKNSFPNCGVDIALTMSTQDVVAITQPDASKDIPMINMQGSKGNAVAQDGGPSYTLNAMHGHDVHAIAVVPDEPEAICIKGAAIGRKPEAGPQYGETLTETSYTLNCVDQHGVMTPTMHVRRLTPIECERLQGFPDGWTDIRPGGKETPDSPRYKALGNSMAVPVMRWIGMRIAQASAQNTQ